MHNSQSGSSDSASAANFYPLNSNKSSKFLALHAFTNDVNVTSRSVFTAIASLVQAKSITAISKQVNSPLWVVQLDQATLAESVWGRKVNVGGKEYDILFPKDVSDISTSSVSKIFASTVFHTTLTATFFKTG